jgi:hypothetical protein
VSDTTPALLAAYAATSWSATKQLSEGNVDNAAVARLQHVLPENLACAPGSREVRVDDIGPFLFRNGQGGHPLNLSSAVTLCDPEVHCCGLLGVVNKDVDFAEALD